VDIAAQTEHPWPDPTTGPWLLRVSFALAADRLVPVGVEMWAVAPPTSGQWATWHAALPDGQTTPLTPPALRIPLSRLADGLAADVARYMPTLTAHGHQEVAEAVIKTHRKRGPVPVYGPEHWQNVVAVYRQADQRRPTTTVAERFGVSRSAAAKWIARCRQMGLLDPA
jgi:hypothetical protein